jgi:hypothetical protein
MTDYLFGCCLPPICAGGDRLLRGPDQQCCDLERHGMDKPSRRSHLRVRRERAFVSRTQGDTKASCRSPIAPATAADSGAAMSNNHCRSWYVASARPGADMIAAVTAKVSAI